MEQIYPLQSLSLEKSLKACGPLGHVGSNPTPGATVTPTVFSGLFPFLEDLDSLILELSDILVP